MVDSVLFAGVAVAAVGGIAASYAAIRVWRAPDASQRRIWLATQSATFGTAYLGMGIVIVSLLPRLGFLGVIGIALTGVLGAQKVALGFFLWRTR